MLPIPLIISLIQTGVFILNDRGNFSIDFAKVAEEYPLWLEEIVLSTLNDLEIWSYANGYMMYKILPSGDLMWMPTMKLRNAYK